MEINKNKYEKKENGKKDKRLFIPDKGFKCKALEIIFGGKHDNKSMNIWNYECSINNYFY